MQQRMEEKKERRNILDKFIDFIFSISKEQSILFLTVFFGFLFRLINVNNRMVYGDPPHFVVNAINFLNSGILVLWDQSTFLWYALTDIFYKIFGVTQFASRFSSLLFGTLTIIAIYLFAKEFSGNKRIGLISALIYAFAPAFIFHAADEHDISALFFIILTFYCLVKGIKKNSKNYLLLSGVLFGIACMWKAYVPILIVPYIGFMLYYHLTKRFDLFKHYKTFIYIFIIIFLLSTPAVVYNYSNYKHNQIPTFFFVKFFKFLDNEKIRSLYGWVSGGELYKDKFSLYELFIDGSTDAATGYQKSPVALTGLKTSVYSNGPILWVIAIFGIIVMFIKSIKTKEKFARDYLIFFMLYFIIPFLVLIQSNTIPKHYIHFLAFAIPIIAYVFNMFYEYINSKFKISDFMKKNLYILFVALLLFEFFALLSLPHGGNKELFFYSNPEDKLINYKLGNIPENSLILYDDRIYNSLAAWLFNDRFYIPISLLGEFMNYNEKSANKQNIPVFIVECGIDDCGWGTIHENPALNKSMEDFFFQINNQSIKKVFFVEEQIRGDYYNPLISKRQKANEYYIVYKIDLPIDLVLAKQFKMQQSSFLYPLRYENKNNAIFKNFIYTPSGTFEILLNKFAWLVFYIDMLVSFLIILFILYELTINADNSERNNEK